MLNIVFFGTYDLTKPRQKIIIEAARRANFEYKQIHADIWKVKDKSKISLITMLAIIFFGFLRSLILIIRYILCPKHKFVFIGYPGLLDIFLVWPFARVRKARIVYDCYLPLYEILVEERKILKASSTAAKLVLKLEKIVLAMADIILTDTRAHAEYISAYSATPLNKIHVIYVGAESFFERSASQVSDKLKLLFYGQVAPLHGFSCIFQAIKILEKDRNIFFTIVGGSKDDIEVQNLVNSHLLNFEYKQWVNYENLVEEIAKVDICLGTFGKTEKANRVIANKTFQALTAGATVITAATRAIAEIEIQLPKDQLIQVSLEDEQQLAEHIRNLADKKARNISLKYPVRSFYPQIVDQFKNALNDISTIPKKETP